MSLAAVKYARGKHGSQSRQPQERRPEGKEGAGAQQDCRYSEQAGHPNRRANADYQKAERNLRQDGDNSRQTGGNTSRRSGDDHQKTVQGKNQRGPEAKVGRDPGENENAKRFNVLMPSPRTKRGPRSQDLLYPELMTQDERLQLLEDIKKSNHTREEIVRRAEADQRFDIAAAWEEVGDLEESIASRIRMARLES